MEESNTFSPVEFYKNCQSSAENKVAYLKKRLLALSSLRLLVFVLTVLLVYFLYPSPGLIILCLFLGIGTFLYLVHRYSDLKYEYRFQKEIGELCSIELQIAQGKYSNRPTGSEYLNQDHYYSNDIDLFGKGSFFQYLNRTVVSTGTDELARLLLSNNIDDISHKQLAIKELKEIPDWRLNFSAAANLIESTTFPRTIINWIEKYETFIPIWLGKIPLIFGGLSIGLITLTIFRFTDSIFLLYWIVIGSLITGVYFKKVSRLASNCENAIATIKQYSVLMKKIENQKFDSQLLNRYKNKLTKSGRLASQEFHVFARALDHLDNRNNLIYGIIGNGFFLTDIFHSAKIEKWIRKNGGSIAEWFEVIAFFDAYLSLGTFAFNHPNYAFPEIGEGEVVIEAVDMGHPLLMEEDRVLNDVRVNSEQFFIITGANMAGKSTFLRTISLHIIMANVGLPVCAKRSLYSPIKLITSMRTEDSLASNSSYFFAELSRLKFVIDSISQEKYFVVLDEILKGTNSTDKALGSKKFVERLVKSKATGVIATHDLSLCETADYLKEVENFYFDAAIENDELSFDYKLKEGVCKNMNANFLLKKMKIIE